MRCTDLQAGLVVAIEETCIRRCCLLNLRLVVPILKSLFVTMKLLLRRMNLVANLAHLVMVPVLAALVILGVIKGSTGIIFDKVCNSLVREAFVLSSILYHLLVGNSHVLLTANVLNWLLLILLILLLRCELCVVRVSLILALHILCWVVLMPVLLLFATFDELHLLFGFFLHHRCAATVLLHDLKACI
jgi:hypothetical protein